MYPVRTRCVTCAPMFLGSPVLSEQEIQERLSKRMKQLEKVMQRELIKAAATQAAINLSLNAIPIVGSALSIVSSFTLGYQLEKYQKKLQSEGEKSAARIQAHYEKTEQEMAALHARVIEEEYPKAMEELFGKQSPVEGFHGMGFIKRVVKEVSRGAKRISAEAGRTVDTVQEGIDVLRGKRAYEKGLAELRKMEKLQIDNMNAALQEAKAESSTPEYRATTRKRIRDAAMQDPEFSDLARQYGVVAPGQVPRIPTSGRDRARLIIAGTIGVGLIMMLR